MSNFKIIFSVSPWLLLLFVPAVGLTLFLYFKTNKRYRNTRNRIVSMTLHSIVLTLCILVLAGITFTWTEPNLQSELVILVDASYTETSAKPRVDNFVKSILDANGGTTNLAIVKFGYAQETVLPMGLYSPEDAYSTYEAGESADVDETATDICGALTYCWNPVTDQSAVISNPHEARILLLSDGLQTDREAQTIAKRIARDGVKIEVAFLPGTGQTDVWLYDVKFPEKRYSLGEEFEFEVGVNSTKEGQMRLKLTDVCEEIGEEEQREPVESTFDLSFGSQTVKFTHAFAHPGFHILKFELTADGDLVSENNVFYTYYNVDLLSRILILEKYKGESDVLKAQLDERAKGQYLVTTVMGVDDARVPTSAVSFLEYDEVFLVNISHSDMEAKAGLEDALDQYVYEYGGSVFTVGGFERDADGQIVREMKMLPGKTEPQLVPKPHAYDEDDMKGTTYQGMLPVEITKYTPPIGLVFIIDRSASMENDGGTGGPLDAAIKGAVATLEILSPRDYVGVMTLESSSTVALNMTPMTRKPQIVQSIRGVGEGSGGGTAYQPSIRAAQIMLSTFNSVDIKHIVLISDGMPADDVYSYTGAIRSLSASEISFTYFSINNNLPQGIQEAAQSTGGDAFRITKESIAEDLPEIMTEALKLDEYSGAVEESYHPEIEDRVTAVLNKLTQDDLDTITMKGFFSSKEKGYGHLETILKATYLPLYSQWDYGRGKVGSFLCDAENVWSQEFFESEEVGIPVFNGIIDYLAPTNLRREQSLDVNFIEDNYRTQASIYGFEQKEEKDFKLIAFVRSPAAQGEMPKVEKFDLRELSTGGNRFTFENRTAGVHKVTILKVPSSFDVMRSEIVLPEDVPETEIVLRNVSYRVFSYSEEYDSYVDPFTEGKELLRNITTRTAGEGEDPDGVFITDPEKLLQEFMDVYHEYDPRPWLVIVSMVLLLLDIAARKFRFKWLHELVREKKRQRQNL